MIIDPYTWHRLSISEIIEVASDTVAVRFERPSDYTFRAGQYAVVRIKKRTGEQLIRQYSFSSAPRDSILELLIQREPGGEVSNWFGETAKVGEQVELSQAYGSFTITDVRGPKLLIAGRVGIAPFVSMVREQNSPTVHSRFSILYSAREASQFCYRDLLESVGATLFVTGEGSRITPATLQPHVDETTIVYICGSKRFVDGITQALHDLDVPPDRIRRELFTLQ